MHRLADNRPHSSYSSFFGHIMNWHREPPCYAFVFYIIAYSEPSSCTEQSLVCQGKTSLAPS